MSMKKYIYPYTYIYILVYSVFLYWTAGKSNWILPWWYLYARELFANMEFETTYYKKYMQRICMPVPKEKAPSETEMIGASSDF